MSFFSVICVSLCLFVFIFCLCDSFCFFSLPLCVFGSIYDSFLRFCVFSDSAQKHILLTCSTILKRFISLQTNFYISSKARHSCLGIRKELFQNVFNLLTPSHSMRHAKMIQKYTCDVTNKDFVTYLGRWTFILIVFMMIPQSSLVMPFVLEKYKSSSVFFKKCTNTGLFYRSFSVFSNKHHYNFYIKCPSNIRCRASNPRPVEHENH